MGRLAVRLGVFRKPDGVITGKALGSEAAASPNPEGPRRAYRATREPGCEAFEILQSTDDPLCFEVSERFTNDEAFMATSSE